MNANELRLGNYVRQGDKNYFIDECALIDIIEHWRLFKDVLYDPIPLTDEWLKKFGYEYDSFTWSKEGSPLMFAKAGDEGFDVWYNTLTYGELNIIVEFVHEFQNLHSGLGEELTISENKA